MKTLSNFFRVNFTDVKDTLLTLKLGNIDDTDGSFLADLLSSRDPDEPGLWFYKASGLPDGGHELADATIFYNGSNSTLYPTYPLFSNIVGIDLGNDSRIYLHFNV